MAFGFESEVNFGAEGKRARFKRLYIWDRPSWQLPGLSDARILRPPYLGLNGLLPANLIPREAILGETVSI